MHYLKLPQSCLLILSNNYGIIMNYVVPLYIYSMQRQFLAISTISNYIYHVRNYFNSSGKMTYQKKPSPIRILSKFSSKLKYALLNISSLLLNMSSLLPNISSFY